MVSGVDICGCADVLCHVLRFPNPFSYHHKGFRETAVCAIWIVLQS